MVIFTRILSLSLSRKHTYNMCVIQVTARGSSGSSLQFTLSDYTVEGRKKKKKATTDFWSSYTSSASLSGFMLALNSKNVSGTAEYFAVWTFD